MNLLTGGISLTCIGSMDGKHIVIRPPPNSGSYYFNYKHTFSIVLLAIVDADYKFLYVDIGCNGRISDGGVFKNCNIYQMFEEKKLDVPELTPLPGTTTLSPYVLIADDAFPLKTYILKPYSQVGLTNEKRIFNYRLSRARRVMENAFGILSNRFRVFMSPINLVPEKVEAITMVGFPMKKLNVSENKCHCYGIPNYVVVVQITPKNQVMPLCFQEKQ